MEQQNLSSSQAISSNIPAASNNNKRVIILGMIALLLVGSVSYFLGVKSQQNKPLNLVKDTPTITSTEITNTPVPTQNLVVNPMANWKTYKGDQDTIHFSFKYPDEWHLNTNSVGSIDIPWVTVSNDVMQNLKSRTSACFTVSAGLWAANVSLEKIIQDDDATQTQETATSPLLIHTPKKILSITQITIDNIVGIKRDIIRYDEEAPSSQIYISVPNTKANGDESLYKIETCPNTDDTTVNQILSTFKFLNQ